MPADLELALRVRADVRAALQGVGALNRTLGDTARQGGDADAALKGATGAAQALAAAFERAPRPAAAGGWVASMRGALDALGRETTDWAELAKQETIDAFRSMEDALAGFVTTGKFSFRGFVDSVIADLARIAVRQAITGPLAAGIGSLFSGGPSGAGVTGIQTIQAGVGHAGAIAGAAGGVTRAVPPAIFVGAQRYHAGGIAGLRPDEVPIIAERGEAILPRGTGIAPPPIEINFHNEGTPQREVRREVRLDPRAVIVDVFTDDMRRGGPMRRTIERELGGGGVA